MNEVDGGGAGPASGDPNPVARLTNAQVFAHDPESHTTATLDAIIERLTPIILRQRKARQDEATILAQQATIKARNKKPPKKVAPNVKAPEGS